MAKVFTGATRFSSRRGTKTFAPNGKLVHRGRGGSRMLSNPERWSSTDPVEAARIFVGFNVGEEPVWTMSDLIRIVREVRELQTGDPSSTFVAQRGIYTHSNGPVVEENGAQVIILNLEGDPKFEGQMTDLAEQIAGDFDQEEVIVEMTRGNVAKKTIGVGAPLQRAQTA